MMRRWFVAGLVMVAAACGSSKKAQAPVAPGPADTAATEAPPPEGDAAQDPGADRDADGVPDAVDQCPDQAMAMSSGCTKEMMHGCPDDCRRPTLIAP